MTNELIPQIAKVVAVRKETPDVKTYHPGRKGLPFTPCLASAHGIPA